jgi:hypothetical protein
LFDLGLRKVSHPTMTYCIFLARPSLIILSMVSKIQHR